jgi:hypothetical protein
MACINITIHHGGIVRHNPFTYIGGDIQQVNGYDVDYLSLWEIKELVRDLGYVNDIKCWYNISDHQQHVISLNSDADVVNFINVVEDYICVQVHLYVEHMVDHAVVVEERFFLEANPLDGHVDIVVDGDGHGHVDRDVDGDGHVDRVVDEDGHGHVDRDVDGDGHGHGGGGGGDGEGERGGSVDELPRADTPMSRNQKSMPRVKVRTGRIVTPSKKRTSIESASESGQPNI